MKKTDYLAKETTTNLKGIFAIIILLGHLKNSTPMLVGTAIGNLISVWAYLVVGGFFFFSGLPDSGAGVTSAGVSCASVSISGMVSHPFGLFTVMG